MKAAVAVMMLLPNCNMTCSFCITENSMASFTWEEAMAFLKQIKSEGIKTLVMGGGEPLLWREDVFKLAAAAKSLGLTTQLGTNGILLRPGFESSLSIDRYVLPLDGSEERIHNAVRFWRERHFIIVKERIEALASVGKTTTISTVVTKRNQFDILNIANYLSSLNEKNGFLHAWHLYQFVPEGRDGANARSELLLPMDDYRSVTESVRQRFPALKIFNRPDMMRSKTVEFFWMQNGKLWRKLGQTELCQELLTEKIPSPLVS